MLFFSVQIGEDWESNIRCLEETLSEITIDSVFLSKMGINVQFRGIIVAELANI